MRTADNRESRHTLPLVSVLLPVRNAVFTLQRAMESIVGQSHQRLELIVIDDGSRDGSAELARDMAVSEARIRIVPNDGSGIVAALNTGFRVANGEFIARMDADDWSHPERLAKQLAIADDNTVVSCLVSIPRRCNANRGFARVVDWMNARVSNEQIRRQRFVWSPICHPTMLCDRKVIERYGGWLEGEFPEDYELWLRWMAAGVKFEKVPEELFSWSDSPERLSRCDGRYSVDAFYRTKAKYLAARFRAIAAAPPPVSVWGAGRITRRRAEMLIEHGVEIASWVDVDPKKVGNTVAGRPVISPEELPAPGECFVLSYVGAHGARERIARMLNKRGFVEGEHFLLAA